MSAPRTFNNFQPSDNLKNPRTKEVFTIISRSTYRCKNCECKPLSPCDEFMERTTLTLKSQRGLWEMNLKQITDKYLKGIIDEI